MANIGPNNETIYVLPSLEGHYGIVIEDKTADRLK